MSARTLLKSLAERLGPGRPALLVVDMQNDFCAEGGYVSRLGRDVGACGRIVPALRDLIASARAADVPVIWLMAEYEHDAITRPMLAKQREMGVADVCCAQGSWGAAPFGVAPEPGEPVVVKHRYSGFVGTDLDALLAERGVQTLVIAGVQTNVCVESTLRDGHSRGFYIVLAGDCVASHMPAQHDATLANVGFLLGDVTDGATIAGHWSNAEILVTP